MLAHAFSGIPFGIAVLLDGRDGWFFIIAGILLVYLVFSGSVADVRRRFPSEEWNATLLGQKSAFWLFRQRRFRTAALKAFDSADHRKLALGSARMDEDFAALEAFVAKNGDPGALPPDRSPDGLTLRRWVENQQTMGWLELVYGCMDTDAWGDIVGYDDALPLLPDWVWSLPASDEGTD